MNHLATALHFANIFITIIFSIFGSGIGSYKASTAALKAINLQPQAKKEITRICLIGLALIETSVILSAILCILLLTQQNVTLAQSISEFGLAFGMACASLFVGIFSALPVESACLSVARQPLFSQKIMNLMLILSSIIQTTAIFAFVVGLFILFKSGTQLAYATSIALSGCAIGLGSIGPVIALGKFSQTVCTHIGTNRKIYGKLLSFVITASAVIETPLIFALLVSISIILFSDTQSSALDVVRMASAALCISCATFVTGQSSGKTASSACRQISTDEATYSLVSHSSLLSQGIIDTSAIYALMIAIALVIFFK